MSELKINEVIQFYRKQKGFTQKQVAELLYSSEKTISAYETGKRGISTDVLTQVAHVFNMNVADFFNQEKINDDIRKSKIKEVAVTIVKEYDRDDEIAYWVEVDVPETGEILEEVSSDFFPSLSEAEDYMEKVIESKYEVLYYHIKDLTDIIDVEYASLWDSGYAEIKTKAKFDITNNVVFDIEVAETDGIDLEILEREYVIFPDGTEKDVVPIGEEDYYAEELKNGKMVRAKY